MEKFSKIFRKKCSVIGMIHVPALPGTPNYSGKIKEIYKKVEQEANLYSESGVDGIIIENMFDVPYLNRNVGPEIVSVMTKAGDIVKLVFGKPVGIQILAGANKEALAAALAADLDFIRAEGFVFSHIADEGMMNSDAGELLRYRKNIGAEHIAVFTDIKKKHSSHNLTSDVDIVQTAKAAEFFESDGIIITGNSTGQSADINEVKKVKENSNLPVIVGSGINKDNVDDFKEFADALIIGSYFKKDGFWKNDLDIGRIKEIINS